MLQFKCPRCGRMIRFEDTAAGQQGRCPCGATIRIPQTVQRMSNVTFIDDLLLNDDSTSFVGAIFLGMWAGFLDAIWPARSRSRVSPKVQSAIRSPKSRIIAGLLAVVLGVLGIHNFYLGRTGIGIWQLLLSLVGGVVTCGVATLVVLIWAWIEAILIFAGSITDGSGQPL